MEQNNYGGALQQAIGSGFNATSTTTDVIKGIDLRGKTAIVTGGNTGIGLETVKTLAVAGARVIVPARDLEKATHNLRDIPRTETAALDLMDPESIDAFARQFLATGTPLHLLINNAGIMWVPLRRDSQGIESQLATNYLAPFRLTARLWPALKSAQQARVVNVSSLAGQLAGMGSGFPAYRISKTALNALTRIAAAEAGRGDVKVNACSPGWVRTGMGGPEASRLPEKGAETPVWLATLPSDGPTGGFFEDKKAVPW